MTQSEQFRVAKHMRSVGWDGGSAMDTIVLQCFLSNDGFQQ